MDSIPLSAFNLGISFEDYEKVAWNIRRMKLLSPEVKQGILERAFNTFPEETNKGIINLMEDMIEDREVYKIADLVYWKGPPLGQKLFLTAIADYLLSTKYFLD